MALGGNVGDVEAQFHRTLTVLAAHGSELQVAPLYRSSPVSPIPQADYLNTVAALRSSLEAEDLLALAKGLELAAGRRPGPRLGPRPLDIDLLLFGDRISREPQLELPHPALHTRSFVLAPLCAILPRLVIPPDGCQPCELLERLDGDAGIERVAWRRRP